MFNIVRTLKKPMPLPAFARGMLAYGSSEAATRAVRLVSILLVARQISPETLGVAALALSLFELVRVLTSVGIGQRIIAASNDELAAICETANQLFWRVCLSVGAIQLLLAGLISLLVGQTDVCLMLAALALVYPFMPGGLVRIFLAMRDQKMGATARVVAAQNIADSALTLVLVLFWPSAWAIVLPKVLSAPVWLMMARSTSDWTRDPNVTPAPVGAFAKFGPAILVSEIMAAARLNADKLLIGSVLGSEALGLYYFAFNAGLGITQSIVAACNLVLFPHLAKVGPEAIEDEFRRAVGLGLLALVPVVVAQIALAPVYVPIVFGAHWAGAASYVAILALAALPLFAGSVLGARYRALGQPLSESMLMSAATILALLGLWLGAQVSLAAACAGFGIGLASVLIPPLARRFLNSPQTNAFALQGEIQ